MRTALHPVTWRYRDLAILLTLGIPLVSAQAVESLRQNEPLLLVKHIDPQLPADELVAVLKPAPLKQVLIATETSRFKEAVATQVAVTLSQDKPPLIVKRIDLNRLAAEPIQTYQAIVLINTCRAWRPSNEVREFLKSANAADKKKLVVLTTANSGECDLGIAGIDAISAASKRTGIATVSQAVVDKVHARLSAP